MKILLQTEARTISNSELANNQRYLIDLINKISRFRFVWSKNNPSSSCL